MGLTLVAFEGYDLTATVTEEIRNPRVIGVSPAATLVVSDVAAESVAGPEATLRSSGRYLVAVESDVAEELPGLLRGSATPQDFSRRFASLGA